MTLFSLTSCEVVVGEVPYWSPTSSEVVESKGDFRLGESNSLIDTVDWWCVEPSLLPIPTSLACTRWTCVVSKNSYKKENFNWLDHIKNRELNKQKWMYWRIVHINFHICHLPRTVLFFASIQKFLLWFLQLWVWSLSMQEVLDWNFSKPSSHF